MLKYGHLIGKRIIATTASGESISGILQRAFEHPMLTTTTCELIVDNSLDCGGHISRN